MTFSSLPEPFPIDRRIPSDREMLLGWRRAARRADTLYWATLYRATLYWAAANFCSASASASFGAILS